MDDFYNQFWFVLEIAWYRARYELSGNIASVVTVAAILLLLWIFLSPRFKR